MRTLTLSSNLIEQISGFDDLIKLRELNLSGNSISTISGLEGLKSLKEICLHDNQVVEIDGLDSLKELRNLSLHNNPFLDRSEYNDLVLSNSETKEPLNMDEQWENVKFWLENKSKEKEEIKLPVKLLLLGNSEVGKTALRKYLLGDPEYMENSDSTHIAEVHEWPYSKKEIANIWDFGGQDYYHSIHHLFFTEASLYLVIYDGQNSGNTQRKDKDYFDFNVNYWLSNLKHILGQNRPQTELDNNRIDEASTKLLIENKIDKEGHSINIPKKLRIAKHHRISLVPNGQKKHPDFPIFKKGIEYLKATIIHELGRLKKADSFNVLVDFLPVIDKIKAGELSEEKYLNRLDFSKLCSDQMKDEITEDELNYLLSLLHNRGLVLNFYAMPNHIWLNPQGLIKVIHDKLKNIDELTKEKGIIKDKKALVSLKEWNLIDLMMQQEVVFQEEAEGYYVFPQFLPLNITDNALYEIATTNLKPAFSLRFKYFLPAAFMSRIICRYGKKPGNKFYSRYELVFTEEINVNGKDEKIRTWIKADLSKLQVDVYIGELSNRKAREAYITYLFKSLMVVYNGLGEHLSYVEYQ